LVLWTSDGQTLVSAGGDRRVVNWDFHTGQIIAEWQLPQAVAVVALTHDGRYLARGEADGSIELLRVAEKRT
jgi:WD40 repeat protein